MRCCKNIRYGSGKNHILDIYYPDEERYDLLIWFHGGGLEGGSYKNIPFAEDLTRRGIAVASVEYCMYPEAQFPDFITDGAAAVKYVLDHIASQPEIKQVFLSGQSAGAYIILMLAMDDTYFESTGVKREMISGYISDSAQTTVHYNVLKERNLDSKLERIDKASPLYFIGKDSFEGNLLLIYYTDDILCRPEQNKLFYKSIKRLCPKQYIEIVELPGEHCQGSIKRNERGSYDFVEILLKFINDAALGKYEMYQLPQ